MLLVGLLLPACGEEQETLDTAPPVEAEVVAPVESEPTAEPPRPAHGGTVVAIGSYFVEVLVRGDGAVEVLARSDAFPEPLGVRLSATIPDSEGEQNPIVLTWDPARERFRGRMRSLPIPGPIEVKLIDGDHTHVGRSPTVVVSAPPDVEEEPSAGATSRTRAALSPTEPAVDPAPAAAPVAQPTPPTPEVVRPGRVDMQHRRGRASPSDLRTRTDRTRTDRTRTGAPGQATVRIRE